MKKLYTLLSALVVTVSVNAQNLVTNGGFETWTDATTAEGFTPVTSGTFSANNFLTQESAIKHDGNFSAGHTSQDATQSLEAALIPIIAGHTYTMTYWFLDNDTSARTRNWSTWVKVEGTTVTAINVDDAILHDTAYSEDLPVWIQKTVVATAPADATHFRAQIRTYKQNNTSIGGKIYYDSLSLTDNALSVNQNAIAGLKVYPNPVTNGTLYIDSDSNASKSVAIFDVLGKQVVKATTEQSVNVSNLKGGVYIVKITEEGKTATRKLVIK